MEMNKTMLEKRIEERANDRFEKELRKLVEFIYNHPIGRRLKVSLGDENIPVVNHGCNYGLFNGDGVKNSRVNKTNLLEVKSTLLEEYKKQETDELLGKLESIGYLFDQN